MLNAKGSVPIIAHLACNLSMIHAQHARLLTAAKDDVNGSHVQRNVSLEYLVDIT